MKSNRTQRPSARVASNEPFPSATRKLSNKARQQRAKWLHESISDGSVKRRSKRNSA